MGYTVAIVGRPNVGKSTLFNRLVGARKAITDDYSGVTRDRQYDVTEWNGKIFNIIDTGGFVPSSSDVFEQAIKEQVIIAIEEASLLLFMVDVTTGITDLDDALAHELRKTKKPVLLVVNKVDNQQRAYDSGEFYSLGFEELFTLSSMSGSGTGELLDAITDKIPDDHNQEEEQELPKIAIVGQPNVGKSTLLNTLIGENRNIVTNIAGTTRDSIHTHYNLYGREFLLIDTAGIRRKSKVVENLEFYSVIRAIKAIDEADVCLLILDATQGIESQDLKIFSIIDNKKKGVVVLVNKWDLITKDNHTMAAYEDNIKDRLAPFTDVPIIFISAIEKQRIYKAVDVLLQVFENRQIRIPTSKLNDVMLPEIEKYPPPAYRGEYIKIKYITQLPGKVPTFAFFCNHPDYIKQPYRNYLENKLRSHFTLTGVPINIFFRKK
jgi:GTP-binding protein